MNRFAALLDQLGYEPSRNGKLRLMTDYFRSTPDPERGYALAALTGALSFQHAKPGLIRTLISERADPMLFGLSYDFVGDLSETVALMWPAPAQKWAGTEPPTLSSVVTTLATLGKAQLPAQLARWLDQLDETGRWTLLKLVTGALRIGVSARLAKTAVAALGDKDPDEIELIWPGLAPPYLDLFAWLEQRAGKPATGDPVPFRPVMLSHAIEETDLAALDPAAHCAEWKWDGIRVQAVAASRPDGTKITRLYSRTGEDISASFPDLAEALRFDGAIDGELLIMREQRVQSFNVLQQRLNRKSVTPKLLAEFPAHLHAYDLLIEGEEDLRELPLADRRARLEALVTRLGEPRIDLSPQIAFADWDALARARANPAEADAEGDAEAVEGVMIKRRDAPYLPGRPKGLWWKWKRDPFLVDAVLMYAQRGHGKRSSFYSDYTFGVWSVGENGDELVPVGKAYFGFTDAELIEIDRFVRRNTVERFGPVREVMHEREQGLVFEVAFEGLQRSTRHKSGLAMRFPRISRLRWDKPPRDADRIETLEAILRAIEGRFTNGSLPAKAASDTVA
ncbi:MAG TPA: cisplatin damage response ATP-dependent DNA ligase [Xanthobacteraceae bacterium]|nr:cisplatin damage response ATP-dependent DNA ligase [Xanthobacteraceae bacterium]